MCNKKSRLRLEDAATLAITGNSPVVVTPESIAAYFDYSLRDVEPVFECLVRRGDLEEVTPGVYDITETGIKRITLRGDSDLPAAEDFIST